MLAPQNQILGQTKLTQRALLLNAHQCLQAWCGFLQSGWGLLPFPLLQKAGLAHYESPEPFPASFADLLGLLDPHDRQTQFAARLSRRSLAQFL